MNISGYATLVFDCDGVVLDSNRIKTEAFRWAALPYGEDAAAALVAHHVANGGVSRYAKLAHFLKEIVARRNGPGHVELLAAYADAVRNGLSKCAVAEGLPALRAATKYARWMIVSGGDQAELRDIFAARGLEDLFDGGIFGSPDTKDTILAREIATGNLRRPGLFLGDSRYDYEAARAAGLDFLFVSGWSEFADWQDYAAAQGFAAVESILDLLSRTERIDGVVP